MSKRYFTGQKCSKSRQRIMRVGISLALIQELAEIENLVGEGLSNVHALRFTYSNLPPRGWYNNDEEILGYRISREPVKIFFNEPTYLLEVFTWTEPVIKEKDNALHD